MCFDEPDAKQITNNNIDENNQRAPSRALDRATGNEHGHAGRSRTDDRAAKEQCNGGQDDGFPSPDVGELGPDGAGGGVGQEVCGAHPCVAGAGVEMSCYRRDRCGHDRLVEGCYE